MEFIANIITNNVIKTSRFIKVSSSLDEVNLNLPTLIIGWENVKNMFPEQDILNEKINDKISWTFSKRERRYRYEKDLDNFVNKVVSELNEKITYSFFNYILASDERKLNFIQFINEGDCSIYHNSRFIYIYNSKHDLIIGISIKDLNYIGIDIDDFINMLNKNDKNIVVNNLNNIDEESFFLIKDNIKIIPYLNYLQKKDIYK